MKKEELHKRVENCIQDLKSKDKIKSILLDLKGTDFQIKVWKALLNIDFGKISTYRDIAEQINLPKSVRAVGTAVGKNPIALIIPCHRVIRTDGGLGGYMWGIKRKKDILEWEGVREVKSEK